MASAAGNQYVNRNLIGAVVGVQPFGGHGLSGTGPKAGGPLYLSRLLAQRPSVSLRALIGELSGPVGESNTYTLRPKGTVLCIAGDPRELTRQVEAVRATGNRAVMDEGEPNIAAVLFSGNARDLLALNRQLAEREGPVIPVYAGDYPLEGLVDEISLSTNTAAAGGNASLMTIG
jgi:RHH-type proline utilization regulon transcriptional repressor/proline dehydrogenase/delta 1-pyrroline-5-carboxylate dehydrogenase